MTETHYCSTHEWVRVDGSEMAVGISDHAVEALGDIAYIELPEIGRKVKRGEDIAVIESVKAASDIYAPIDGEITHVNEQLQDQPELVNEGPENCGWLFKIKPDSDAKKAVEGLLSAEEYAKLTSEEN